ncbi:MAG TPA: hypothetical protein VF636_05840 [Sphingomonas sp.]|jgi:hypothetical protein
MSSNGRRLPARRGKGAIPARRGGTVAPTRVGPVERRFGDALVQVDRVYRVPSVQPTESGPWTHEADKIAWVDPATGLACIIRRAAYGGHLCGYVGVEPGHSLFGFRHDAFPHVFDIRVHGGLDYSEACERGPEETTVCHVTADDMVHDESDPRWWFGFSCDQPYDVVPGIRTTPDATMAAEPVYRDEAFVFEQCGMLAAQLQAIAEGRPLDLSGTPGPLPIGLDPDRAGS